jgi:uncharacterized protein YneR
MPSTSGSKSIYINLGGCIHIQGGFALTFQVEKLVPIDTRSTPETAPNATSMVG